MDLKVIKKSEMIESHRENGDSTQVYKTPLSDHSNEENFDFKLSLGLLKSESSEFPIHKKTKRYFLGLNDFRLEVDDDNYVLKRGEMTTFEGGQKVTCTGKGSIFNLLINKDNIRGSMQILELNPGEFITEQIVEANVFYYVFEGSCMVKNFSYSEVLETGDLIAIKDSKHQTRLKIISEKLIQLIRVDILYKKE